MTARVLVVDDTKVNRDILRAKLAADYYDVTEAASGEEALGMVAQAAPDIILLDVMMPGLDGFEVCRRLKSNVKTAHIPVILVTALDDTDSRVEGLDAGADDFLTKPVDLLELSARVKNLVRYKFAADEWREQQAKGEQLGVVQGVKPEPLDAPINSGRILIVENDTARAVNYSVALSDCQTLDVVDCAEDAKIHAHMHPYDLIMVSLELEGNEGLRLCSQFRSMEKTRHVPILAMIDKVDKPRIARALELGVNDYAAQSIDANELKARVRSQLRRKRCDDRLRANIQSALELVVKDQLTGLYNRRFVDGQIDRLIQQCERLEQPLSILMIDIDHFKSVNDTHGHEMGDEVLREVARRIAGNVRAADMPCRLGGEEFLVLMPGTDIENARLVGERLRTYISEVPMPLLTGNVLLDLTVSAGVAEYKLGIDSAQSLMRRADRGLYEAKDAGRNRVICNAA